MSLRARLLLAVGAVALVALVIADVVTYHELRSFLFTQVDQGLEASHMPVERALGSSPSGLSPGLGTFPGENAITQFPGALPPQNLGESNTASAACAPALHLSPGTFLEIRAASGSKVKGFHCTVQGITSQGAQSSHMPTPELPKQIMGFTSNAQDFGEPTVYLTTSGSKAGDPDFRVLASILESGPYKGGQLIVATSLGSTSGTLSRLFDVELAVTAAALVGAALLGWWLVWVGLRPLTGVERTAEAIAEGELDQRVPGDRKKTEVGRLARALNVMLGRIETAFSERDATEAQLRESESRMRQFVADASHELRTPLAAISAYAELFERGASTRADDLDRVMSGIHHEAGRMGRLVEDLMLLARLDEGRPIEHEQVELVGLAADAARMAQTVAPQWPITLQAGSPIEIVGDAQRMRQVLDNLLSNVRSHTLPGTTAVINLATDQAEAVITVTDNGPGLDNDQLVRVFERFYRADPSRSRLSGGAGLGLSIVASIVRAHGGTVSAASQSQGGAQFTVRIPLSPDSPQADSPQGDPGVAQL